jgi:hypothetical protein
MNGLYTEQSARIHIEQHQAYIHAGHCGSVARTKAWCNDKQLPSHFKHYAHGVPVGTTEYWSDREADICPCDELPGGRIGLRSHQ